MIDLEQKLIRGNMERNRAVSGHFRLHRTAALRKRPGPLRRQPVQTIRVVTAVWAKALELADGDIRRLMVIDPGTVLVLNNPKRRRQ